MSEILTGYEIYGGEQLDIDASIQKIQNSMFERNPEKYGDFLKTLGKIDMALKIMVTPDREVRVELFKYVYYAMRLIDDVVDGDTNPPLVLDARKELLDSIIEGNIKGIKNPLYKALAIKIEELSSKLNQKEFMGEAIHEIIVSMNYDLARIMDENKVRNAEDLHENFHRMDITGTIVGTAIIFGIDPKDAVRLILPLGEACRVMYNLRDFGEDIIADLINIPKEELEKFGITQVDLDIVKNSGADTDFVDLPESIKNWFQSEIQKIYQLLADYSKNMQQDCLFIDNPNYFLKRIRNIFLKKIIFPKTYINEISRRVPEILKQVS